MKRYHSAQVQSLHWFLWLDKSTASKVLLHFEYTERQGLCLQISLGGRLSSAGVQAASPSCVSWQWGVLAVWVSLQEKFWAAQPAWSQSHSTAAEIKGRFEGCQQVPHRETDAIHMEMQLSNPPAQLDHVAITHWVCILCHGSPGASSFKDDFHHSLEIHSSVLFSKSVSFKSALLLWRERKTPTVVPL